MSLTLWTTFAYFTSVYTPHCATWLHHACASGNVEALHALEAMCPQVHTLYARSYTGALLWAAASGNPDILKAIKKKTRTNHSLPIWYFALSGCAEVHYHTLSHTATEQEIEKTMYIALALGHVALANAITQHYPTCRYQLCIAHRACNASQNLCMRTWLHTHVTFFSKTASLPNAPHATPHLFFIPPRTNFLARKNPDFNASLFHDIP